MGNQTREAALLDELIIQAAERGVTDPNILAREIEERGDDGLQRYALLLGVQVWMSQVRRRGGRNG